MVDDVTLGPPRSLRGHAGRALQRVFPNADEWAFRRSRRADHRVRMQSGAYDEWLKLHPITLGSQQPSLVDLKRSPHVVVVPHEGADYPSWAPGTRNFYFEAAQVLRERTGPERVSVFHVNRGTSPTRWHTALIDYLNDRGATHVLTHIEDDPGAMGTTWSWDTAWSLMCARWDGVLLGVMFDSAYRNTLLRGRYLAHLSPRFVLVDICMPMNGQLVRTRPEVGPLNMPMSNLSMALVDERKKGVRVEYDVTFLGVLYDYRAQLIDELRASGVRVAVNTHRQDVAHTRAETLRNQPSWIDYMAALAGSRMTINFSESAARPVQQLKTRVIEAGLAGTFLLTDDVDRTSLFWREGEEYAHFTEVSELPVLVPQLIGNPEYLRGAKEAFAAKARFLAHEGFWSGIDSTLRPRGLPVVGA